MDLQEIGCYVVAIKVPHFVSECWVLEYMGI